MVKKHRFLLIFLPIYFGLLYCISQNKEQNLYAQLIREAKVADSFYNAATALNTSDNYDEQKEIQLNEQALNIYKDILKKAPESSTYDSMRFFSAFRTGELEHYFEHFTEALAGYKKAIEIKTKSKLSDSLLFKPYLYSGILYYNQNKYDSATISFKNAETIQVKYNYELTESERLFNTFGALYYEKGDYRQAKNYFQKALEVLPQSHPYYKQLYSIYNINLAQIYFKLEDYDEANIIYQKLLPLEGVNKNDVNQNIGLINLYLGAPAKALSYFRKISYTGSSKLIWLYHNIGSAFFNLKELDSARIYFQKAIQSSNSFGSNTDHIAYGQTLKSLGDLEMEIKNTNAALNYYQRSIIQFFPSFTDTSVYANPTKFSGAFSYINLFNALVAKAEAFHFIYQVSSSIEDAKNELKAYQSAFRLIDYVERTYNSDEARLFLDKIKYLVHTKPIDIAYELYLKTKDKSYLEELYIFDQQNKASVLALKTQLQNVSTTDTSLLSKERTIRTEITRLSLKASQLTDSNSIATINKNIRDQEIELGKIQEKLSNTSNSIELPSIKSLQKEFLDSKTTLISFHLSEEKLTTVVISRERFECTQKKLFPNFHDVVEDYIMRVKDPFDTTTMPGKQLSNLLFADIDLANAERLIIIPDDELNYLSFESLKAKQDKYLIQKYSIQYQYSTSLLKKQDIKFTNQQTLSIAPFAHKSFKDSLISFESLPNSLNEIKDLKGEKFIDSTATKSNFLNHLSQYKILHLATHAVVNSKENGLSFISFYPSTSKQSSDFLLYSEEIYNLPLNKTDLVILSACETGSGNLVKGEGIMSLSRAFAYAGCPNIVTSLWNANDFSTAYLTNRFHFYLNKNYAIDRALQQAKLDYLDDRSINPRLKHPFYWSHLVFIGSYTTSKSPNYWWEILAVVAIIIVVSWVILKKPHRKARLY